jgi:cobalamin biosynthesis protein CobT
MTGEVFSLTFFFFRAEKKNKKILDLINDVSEHLQMINGKLKCDICGEDFSSQKVAAEHVNKEHSSKDFEHSDSDASVKSDESSEESDGSSGVESSELEESEDYADSEGGNAKPKSQKFKISSTEPEEVKRSRVLITEYAESSKYRNIAAKTIPWTKEM